MLEIRDPKTVKQLVSWFDQRIWDHPDICKLDEATVRKKLPFWAVHQAGLAGSETGGRVPKWQSGAPEPPLTEAQFTVGAQKNLIRHLLAEFRTNRCPYRRARGGSCAQVAVAQEKRYKKKVQEFRSLWRIRHSWSKENLEKLFDLGFTHGRAAKIGKPGITRQAPKKVVNSLEFLLQGEGDPFVRFEKMLRNKRYKLRGLGEAGLAFLMHLWNPKEFAIINGPIDKSLKKLSVTFKGSRRKGQALKNRTAAIHALAEQTGLKTFGRVDHFLDAIGKGHIGKSGIST